MSDLIFESLDKNIHVYKNLIPEPEKLVEILKVSEKNPEESFFFSEWSKWSVFGSYLTPHIRKSPDNNSQSEMDRFLFEQRNVSNINDAFFKSTNHFLNYHNITKGDDWVIMGPSYSKYIHDRESHNPDLEMEYHTDYKPLEADGPGNKFVITCTMYLNDDYDEGGLEFITGNKTTIHYKPKAGDVLVFPSGHPDFLSDDGRYFHGVKKVLNADKYLIRCFYQIPFAGTEEWHKNKEKFGAEEWDRMETERIQASRRYHDFQKGETVC
jgi:hypothetical protein